MKAEKLEQLIKAAPPDNQYYSSGIHLTCLLDMCSRANMPDAIFGHREMLEGLRRQIVVDSKDWTERPEHFYGIKLKSPPVDGIDRRARMPKNVLVVASEHPIPSGSAYIYTDISMSPEGEFLDPPSSEEVDQAVSSLGLI